MIFKPVLVALALLTVFHEDAIDSPEKRAQSMALAEAIYRFGRTAEERAFMVALGKHETNFSLRVHVGRCRPWECDKGRARGPWQGHRNGMSDADWARMVGVENTRFQAERAAMHVRWALRQCPDDRVRGAFRALGGLKCDQPLRGEDERVADFERVRGRLQ